jgi:hypothetical protein
MEYLDPFGNLVRGLTGWPYQRDLSKMKVTVDYEWHGMFHCGKGSNKATLPHKVYENRIFLCEVHKPYPYASKPNQDKPCVISPRGVLCRPRLIFILLHPIIFMVIAFGRNRMVKSIHNQISVSSGRRGPQASDPTRQP